MACSTRLATLFVTTVGLVALAMPPAAKAEDWQLTSPSQARGRRNAPTPRAPRVQTRAASRLAAPEILRERYLQALLGDPMQDFAFERLIALAREHDGSLDALCAALQQKQVAPQQQPALWLTRGRLEAARGQSDAARAAYLEAAALRPAWSAPHEAQADLAQAEGNLDQAAALLQQVLALQTGKNRAVIERRLAELAIDRQDFEAATRLYQSLAAHAKGGVFAATEYARTLAARGLHARAVTAYEQAIKALAGDDRVLPPVLLSLAKSQLATDDHEAALVSLGRARRLAPTGTGTRVEIDEALVDAYRRMGRLPEYVIDLAAVKARTAYDNELLARLHDELGDPTQALASLRQALAQNPGSIEARERVIAILTRQGELDAAITEYRTLVRVAPREPRFVIDLCKLLIESGQRAEALRQLAQTGRRFASEARILRVLFDVYSRWGEHALATQTLKQLTRIDPSDPTHFIALGDQLLQDGNEAGALAAWHKVLETGADKARAHATLGDNFLDHDMPDRALAEFDAAVQSAPESPIYLRGLAEALERMGRPLDAAQRWLQVLQFAGEDRALRTEARRRVARLWAATGELQRRIAELELAFMFSPTSGSRPDAGTEARKPDIEAGRFLVEAYRALATGRRRGQGDSRQFESADRVLERLLELVPGDLESLQALERSRVLRGDLAGALKVLARLLDADPKNAQSYLGRMAEHSLTLYRDDDAITYAERLLALRPNDAQAHARLGDLYRARQDTTRAVVSYERARVLDATTFDVHVKLAEIYVSIAQPRSADTVLREVVRKSTDDELVKRAARLLMQLNRGAPELADLEQFLLPLALARPQRPVYRRALVELYDAVSRPTAAATQQIGAGLKAADAASIMLGQRAIKPLLEALADTDTSQRRIAVDLLGQLGNAYAAVALLMTAEHDDDIELRRRALLGAARVAPETLAKRFLALARAPERRLRDAAAFGLARMSGSVARAALRELLLSATPSVRGLALMGLGRLCDASSIPAMRTLLATDSSALVRGAAALALGTCRDHASLHAIGAALRTEHGESALAAAVALGGLGDRTAVAALSEAMFSIDPSLRTTASWSLRLLAREPQPTLLVPELTEPDDPLSLGPWLGRWMAREPEAAMSEMLATFGDEVRASAQAALLYSSTSARTVLALLSGEDPAPSPGPTAFVALRNALLPELRVLAKHADPQVRAAALTLLADSGMPAAAPSFVAALDDDDTHVQSAALDAIRAAGPIDSGEALRQLHNLAVDDERWWVRRRAVLALGQAGTAGVPTLLRVLREDAYAYVRQAAAKCLGELRASAARESLTRAATGDAEIRVRQAAAEALARLPPPGPAAGNAQKSPD